MTKKEREILILSFMKQGHFVSDEFIAHELRISVSYARRIRLKLGYKYKAGRKQGSSRIIKKVESSNVKILRSYYENGVRVDVYPPASVVYSYDF